MRVANPDSTWTDKKFSDDLIRWRQLLQPELRQSFNPIANFAWGGWPSSSPEDMPMGHDSSKDLLYLSQVISGLLADVPIHDIDGSNSDKPEGRQLQDIQSHYCNRKDPVPQLPAPLPMDEDGMRFAALRRPSIALSWNHAHPALMFALSGVVFCVIIAFLLRKYFLLRFMLPQLDSPMFPL